VDPFTCGIACFRQQTGRDLQIQARTLFNWNALKPVNTTKKPPYQRLIMIAMVAGDGFEPLTLIKPKSGSFVLRCFNPWHYLPRETRARVGDGLLDRWFERFSRFLVISVTLSNDLKASFTSTELRNSLATSGSSATTFAPSLMRRR